MFLCWFYAVLLGLCFYFAWFDCSFIEYMFNVLDQEWPKENCSINLISQDLLCDLLIRPIDHLRIHHHLHINHICCDRNGTMSRSNGRRFLLITRKVDFRFAPSQWETSLQSNSVSRWLSTNLESTLTCIRYRYLRRYLVKMHINDFGSAQFFAYFRMSRS